MFLFLRALLTFSSYTVLYPQTDTIRNELGDLLGALRATLQADACSFWKFNAVEAHFEQEIYTGTSNKEIKQASLSIIAEFHEDDRPILNRQTGESILSLFPVERDNVLQGILILVKHQCKDCGFSDQDIQIIKAFGPAIALSIRNVELLNYAKLESEIVLEISRSDDLKQSLDSVLEHIVAQLHAQYGYIILLRRDTKLLIPFSTYGITADIFPELEIGSGGLLEHVYTQEEPMMYPSGTDMDKQRVPLRGGGEYEIAAPMKTDQEIIGIIGFVRDGVSFVKDDNAFLEKIAAGVALIVQNQRFYESSLALGRVHFRDMDRKTICDLMAISTSKILYTPITIVRLIHNIDGQRLMSIESYYHSQDRIIDTSRYDMGEVEGGISWEVVRETERLVQEQNPNISATRIVEDVKSAPEFKYTDFAQAYDVASMLSAPILVGEKVLGVVNTYSIRKCRFWEKEVSFLNNLAKACGSALMNAKLTEEERNSNAKLFEIAITANPGHVALDFVHDIKHVMSSVNALLSTLIFMLSRKRKESEEGKQIIKDVNEETKYLMDLFTSLVDFAKQKTPYFHSVPIKQIIDRAAYLCRVRLESQKIKFTLHFDSPEAKAAEVYGVQDRLVQVLVNLFNNSIYSLRHKSIRNPKVEIHVRLLSNECIELLFSDNGTGISPYDLPKVYELLFTTKGDEGSGFGIPICKRIVEEMHHGKLTIKSTFGKYTTVIVTLPIDFTQHEC